MTLLRFFATCYASGSTGWSEFRVLRIAGDVALRIAGSESLGGSIREIVAMNVGQISLQPGRQWVQGVLYVVCLS